MKSAMREPASVASAEMKILAPPIEKAIAKKRLGGAGEEVSCYREHCSVTEPV
jgi:hypothetical protein